MTLEDKHSYVMEGRKDDVNRTPKQHRKRPLSAVLEEFEVDDLDLLEQLTNNSNNNNNKSGSSKCGGQQDKTGRERADDRVNCLPEAPERCRNEANGSSPAKTQTINSPSTPPSVSTLKALFERGIDNRQTSPKIPRKIGPKFGGRRPSTLSPSMSPKISRRGSSGYYSSSGDSDDDISPTSDMTLLRQTADRLCLSTRRPSVLQWRAQYVESTQLPLRWDAGSSDVSGQNGDGDERLTEERREKINSDLDWIRNELQKMRTQDQQLARQLLTIRSDLHRLKLARSCEEHQDMLDDVQLEMEELQEFADVLDLPNPTFTDSPLKHLGVTRMNLSARRFSTC